MTTMASQITSLAVVYSIVYSGADQRKHQSSASLAFVRGIHRTGEFPAQRASNSENVCIWWRHQGDTDFIVTVRADVLAHNGDRRSPGTVMTTKLNTFPSKFLCMILVNYFGLDYGIQNDRQDYVQSRGISTIKCRDYHPKKKIMITAIWEKSC